MAGCRCLCAVRCRVVSFALAPTHGVEVDDAGYIAAIGIIQLNTDQAWLAAKVGWNNEGQFCPSARSERCYITHRPLIVFVCDEGLCRDINGVAGKVHVKRDGLSHVRGICQRARAGRDVWEVFTAAIA